MSTSAKQVEVEIAEQIGEDLPEGWAHSTLSVIGDYLNGRAFKTSEWSTKGRPIIRIQDLTGTKDSPNYFKGALEDRYVVRPGDFLISWSATLGAYIWEGPEGVLNQHIFKVQTKIDKSFHRWLVEFLLQDLYRQTHGSGMVHITKGLFDEIPVPIPPLGEQKRIVKRIEKGRAEVDRARGRLSKTSFLLKKFRQAVLAAACSGKLTEDWRETHPDIEPADALIRKLTARRKSEDLDIIEGPTELPGSWVWVTFGTLIGQLRNGISTKPEIDPPGKPILRISAVRSGKVALEDYRYLRSAGDLSQYQVRNGDLLFTRYNGTLELLGVCGMVRGVKDNPLLYPDKLMRARFDHPWILPSYAELFFGSPGARDRITDKAKSSAGQQGVSGADVKEQPIAFPPTEEQREIVRRVEALFKLADAIEKRLAAATLRAERLTQAILAKAFRGELVPTEAELARREGREYEPAAVLLERIKRAREKATEKNRSVGRKLDMR